MDSEINKSYENVNTPIKNGLILAVIMCVTALAMALVSPRTYIMAGRTALLIAVIYFMYKMGKDEKSRHEGVLDFGEAFKAIFVGSSVAYLIFSVFEYILFNFINPDLNIIFHEVTIEGFNYGLDLAGRLFDADQDALGRVKEEITSEITVEVLRRNIGNALSLMMGNIIFPCLIVGLIMALITKSKNT